MKLPAYLDAGVPEVWHADSQDRTIVVYGLSEDRKSYIVASRGGEGETVVSRVLPDFGVEVSEVFAPESE